MSETKAKESKQSWAKKLELKIDKQSDLTKRLISSIFLAIFVVIYIGLAVCYEEGIYRVGNVNFNIAAYFELAITMILAGACAYELMKAMNVQKAKDGIILMVAGIVITAFMVFYPWINRNWAMNQAMDTSSWNKWFLILVVNIAAIVVYAFIAWTATKSWMKTFLFLIYIYVVICGFKGFLTIGMSLKPIDTANEKMNPEWLFGWNTIIWAWAIIILTDTFAYLGGRKFGKTPLAPKVSPKKTWEGSGIGSGVAIIFGILYSVLFAYLLPEYSPLVENMYNLGGTTSAMPGVALALYTILISLAGQIGDLFFSFYKRTYEVKDFSKLIPGHGGILDRMDSFLFVFFLIYLISMAS